MVLPETINNVMETWNDFEFNDEFNNPKYLMDSGLQKLLTSWNCEQLLPSFAS